jgi:hypothetical protein
MFKNRKKIDRVCIQLERAIGTQLTATKQACQKTINFTSVVVFFFTLAEPTFGNLYKIKC